jgi:sporulation integral membrane protein YtvI
MLLVLALILAVTGVLVYLGYYLFTQVSDLLGSWDRIQQAVTSFLRVFSDYVQNNLRLPFPELEEYTMDTFDNVVAWLTDKISTWAPNVVVGVSNLASGIVSFLISLIFFIVGAYFMTSDYPALRNRLASWVPEIIQPHVHHIKAAMGTATFGYLKAQVILSGVVTLIIFLALTIWGQDYAIIIALICGIIDLVPFFGSGTILVPWAVIELFMTSYSKALFLLILALGLFLFRKLAEPKVVGNQTGLSPLLSLITIYVGMKLGGVVGMILMPILCMMIISLYRVGFFDPTLRDLKMLFQRVIQAAKIEDDQA